MSSASAGRPGIPDSCDRRVSNGRAQLQAADGILGFVGGAAWFEQVMVEHLSAMGATSIAGGLVATLKVALHAPSIALYLKVKMRDMAGKG
ncbi:hypothetical protein ABZT26_03010 [Streptomyces sp. NPDC005395]|uniref:hypothetical protein n=1 Tax=Streptomyces sp. NPDC005395 TaxID=3157042 RepID=UPI0033AC345F